MRCNQCGAELLPNDTFCGNCGNRISVPANINTAEDSGAYAQYAQPVFPDTAEADPTAFAPYDEQWTSDAQPDYGAENYYNQGAYPSDGNGKRRSSAVLIILITVLLLLVLFTAFNFLLMTDRIDVDENDFLKGYKESLSEFLNLSDDSDGDDGENVPQTGSENGGGIRQPTDVTTTTTAPPTTQPTTNPTTTTTTTTADPQNNIPAELQQYAGGLVYEGKTYRITLKESDWKINYRSEPKLIDVDEPNNNILGKMQHGTEIYVEYIYNGTWAVFIKDGRYVFASLYASNDPSQRKLMQVV